MTTISNELLTELLDFCELSEIKYTKEVKGEEMYHMFNVETPLATLYGCKYWIESRNISTPKQTKAGKFTKFSHFYAKREFKRWMKDSFEEQYVNEAPVKRAKKASKVKTSV